MEGIGASSKRREDVRFLTGVGNYTDDINLNADRPMCISCARTWRMGR